MVVCQVGDDHSEGVEHCQGSGGGEVQVPPHMEVQNVQWKLSTGPGYADLPAEVVDALQCAHKAGSNSSWPHSSAVNNAVVPTGPQWQALEPVTSF